MICTLLMHGSVAVGATMSCTLAHAGGEPPAPAPGAPADMEGYFEDGDGWEENDLVRAL